MAAWLSVPAMLPILAGILTATLANHALAGSLGLAGLSALAGTALMNAINYYLPDRDDVTARVESVVQIKGAAPIEFTDYLYANDGAEYQTSEPSALAAAPTFSGFVRNCGAEGSQPIRSARAL